MGRAGCPQPAANSPPPVTCHCEVSAHADRGNPRPVPKLSFLPHIQRIIPQRQLLTPAHRPNGPRHAEIPTLVRCVILLSGIQVLRLCVRKSQLRYCPDKRPAALEYIHLRISLLVKGHPVVHLHPPRDASVIAPCEVYPVPQGRLIDAFSPAGIPNCRIGHSVNGPPLQPRVGLFDLPYLGKLLLRGPPHPSSGFSVQPYSSKIR